MFLLKIAKTSNFTRARCLMQKNNHFTIRAITHRFYSKEDKPPTTDQKVPADSNEDKLWADVQKNQQKKYRSIALVGLLLAAAALGSIFYAKKKQQKAKENFHLTIKRHYLRPKPVIKVPEKGKLFPKHVPYLLIGGGTASFAAFRAIKSADPKAQVLVISNESNNPYMRPPLSKEMWFTDSEQTVKKLIFKQWNGTERSLFYEPQDFYTEVTNLETNENGGVAVALGWNVNKIDVYDKKVILEDDTEISYDKCLIATGASPKNLEVFEQAKPAIKDKVTLFREIFDFQELNEVCNEAKSIAIVGGGFLGSELACALGRKGKNTGMKVYQIFKEPGNMGKVLPEYLSAWTTNKVREEGVQIVHNAEVEDVSQNEQGSLLLHLNNGHKLTVDHVIVSIGVKPNTKLAETSELEVDPELGGYLVNTEMEARSNLYVAGDCSCFYDTKLGRRRVEHHDHAVVSGRLAGENMTGANKPYLHQSMFWSDLGPDVGYEAIGIVDSTLPTVGVFAKASENDSPRAAVSETNDNIRSNAEAKPKPSENKDKHDSNDQDFGKGVIFYLKDNTVVGIVLWNVFNRMSIARQVLKDRRKYDDLNEVAKLFNIHDDEKVETASAN